MDEIMYPKNYDDDVVIEDEELDNLEEAEIDEAKEDALRDTFIPE